MFVYVFIYLLIGGSVVVAVAAGAAGEAFDFSSPSKYAHGTTPAPIPLRFKSVTRLLVFFCAFRPLPLEGSFCVSHRNNLDWPQIVQAKGNVCGLNI